MPDLTVSQFGNVWECLRSVEALGISRAAVVRFAERTGGVGAQLYPNAAAAAAAAAAAQFIAAAAAIHFN